MITSFQNKTISRRRINKLAAATAAGSLLTSLPLVTHANEAIPVFDVFDDGAVGDKKVLDTAAIQGVITYLSISRMPSKHTT